MDPSDFALTSRSLDGCKACKGPPDPNTGCFVASSFPFPGLAHTILTCMGSSFNMDNNISVVEAKQLLAID